MHATIEPLLFLFLLLVAVAIARLKDLFAAAMLTGIFSLLSAGLFTLMDAVDVALTEAAVGVGISTVLILSSLSLTLRHEDQQPPRVLPFAVVLLTGAALLYGTADMPAYGDPRAAIHHHVAPDYFRLTQEQIEVPNVVTAILGSFRGFDTLGETAVIFTGGLGVVLLLGGARRRRSHHHPPPQEAAGPARGEL